MISPMTSLLLMLSAVPAVACTSGPGPVDPASGMTRAERNLCEQMRSFQPYRSGECRYKR